MLKAILATITFFLFVSPSPAKALSKPVEMIQKALTEPYEDHEAVKTLFQTVFNPASDEQACFEAMKQYLKVGLRPELVLDLLSLSPDETERNGWGGRDLPRKLVEATSPKKHGEEFELSLIQKGQWDTEVSGYFHQRLLIHYVRWYTESSEAAQAKLLDVLGSPSERFVEHTSRLSGDLRKEFLESLLQDIHPGFQNLLDLTFVLQWIQLNPKTDGWMAPKLADLAQDKSLDKAIINRSDANTIVRESMIESLGKVSPKGSTLPPLIADSLGSNEQRIKASALRAAGEILTDEKVHQDLLENLTHDGNSYIRWLAFQQAAEMKNVRPDLQDQVLNLIRQAPPTVDINHRSENESVAYGYLSSRARAKKKDLFAKLLIVEGLKSKSTEIIQNTLWAMRDWHLMTSEIQLELIETLKTGRITGNLQALAYDFLRDHDFVIDDNKSPSSNLDLPENADHVRELKEIVAEKCAGLLEKLASLQN